MHLSRDDNRLAKLIEESIPDSLRLAKHPDAELVNLAIATVLLAIKESSSLTLRGQRHDIREALEGYFGHTFAPHIAKEDEDWGALQSKAKSAEDIRKELHEAIGQAVHEFKQGAEEAHASAYEKAMAAFRANPRAVLSDIVGTTAADRIAQKLEEGNYTDGANPPVEK